MHKIKLVIFLYIIMNIIFHVLFAFSINTNPQRVIAQSLIEGLNSPQGKIE